MSQQSCCSLGSSLAAAVALLTPCLDLQLETMGRNAAPGKSIPRGFFENFWVQGSAGSGRLVPIL